jgi:hypothetical protein
MATTSEVNAMLDPHETQVVVPGANRGDYEQMLKCQRTAEPVLITGPRKGEQASPMSPFFLSPFFLFPHRVRVSQGCMTAPALPRIRFPW